MPDTLDPSVQDGVFACAPVLVRVVNGAVGVEPAISSERVDTPMPDLIGARVSDTSSYNHCQFLRYMTQKAHELEFFYL